MLNRIFVRNYVLISELELELQKGFTVVTGETGAGKSIILGALRLVLGERADSKVLFDPDTKCIVEVQFNISTKNLNSFFEENDLDYADETVVRREIAASGKSRAFINDTPVTLPVLKQFGQQLLDIHSQHETLELKSRAFLYDVVDAFAETLELRTKFQEAFHQAKSIREELEALKEEEQQSKADLDYFTFQYNELDEAQLKGGELLSLEEEFNVLSKSEDITNAMQMGEEVLDGQRGVLELLNDLKNTFQDIAGVGESYGTLYQRLDSVYLELKDLSEEISNFSGAGDHDPARLTELTDRINLLNTLLQKHRLNTEEELINFRDELQQKVEGVSSLEEEIVAKEQALTKAESTARQQADKLFDKREKKLSKLKKEVEGYLHGLAMGESEVSFDLQKQDSLHVLGGDTLEVKFRTNKGTPFELVHKAASGGELARFMLSVKAVISGKKQLPTIIFDEIDTGVSGEVASKMGQIMQDMGAHMQVLSITHLPQVAGKGQHHFTVYKEVKDDRTFSHIKPLTQEERLLEIAKMLSGDSIAQSAMDTARELMTSAG